MTRESVGKVGCSVMQAVERKPEFEIGDKYGEIGV